MICDNNVPVTVDVIVELNSRQIVLIERLNYPFGKALPGGFVEAGESLAEAAVREAKEETGLDVHLDEQFFAYSRPGRDPRGAVVSVVFIATAMGTPVAADDAKEAHVVSVDELPPNEDMAFDHGDILNDYVLYRKRGARPGPRY